MLVTKTASFSFYTYYISQPPILADMAEDWQKKQTVHFQVFPTFDPWASFFLRLQLINTMTLQVKRDKTTRKESHLHHILEESHQFIINIWFKFYMKNK